MIGSMMDQLRIPPHSEEAERGILGSILLEPDSLEKCALRNLSHYDFYDRRHQALYEQLSEMRSANVHIDAITIGEWLKKNNCLEKVGGYDYLVQLQGETLVPSYVNNYCEIVQEKRMYRRIIEESSIAIDNAYRMEDQASMVLELLSSNLNRISPERESITDPVAAIMDECERVGRGEVVAIPTPIPGINMRSGGLRRGLVHVFCGRAKAGKSMFKAWWLNHLGQNNFPALDLCFEDRTLITLSRRAGNLGGYNAMRMLNGGSYVRHGENFDWYPVTTKELDKHRKCLEVANAMPIYHHDERCTPDGLAEIASYYHRKHGIVAMFIDGTKDVKRPAGKYNDTGMDEEISQRTVEIASSLDIAVIPIYHLTKIDPTSLISSVHIRGSGNIVSDARGVWAL